MCMSECSYQQYTNYARNTQQKKHEMFAKCWFNAGQSSTTLFKPQSLNIT